jgi:hypothetical protein
MMADFDTISKEAREENSTFKDMQLEMECLSKDLESAESSGGSGLFCPYSYDTLLCWPKTPAGNLALLPCFEEFNGIKYDTSREYPYLFLVYFNCSALVMFSVILTIPPDNALGQCERNISQCLSELTI